MKKLLLLSFISLTILALTSCSKSETGQETFVNDYLLSGVNGVSLIEKEENNVISDKENNVISDEENIIIDNFLNLENIIGSSLLSLTKETSDNENYEYKYTLSLNLYDGSKNDYIYYYNEYVLEVDDDEVESRLEGIILNDDKTYNLIGFKEVEDYDEEVTYRISSDNSVVVVEKETEDDEESFSYIKYENGKKVLEFELEKEEHGFSEYEIKQKTDNKIYKYEIIERGEKTLVKVLIKENGQTIIKYFTITLDEQGKRVYNFL